jgi:hypothetical protein
VIERLQTERPDASVAELVIEADAVVANEIKERQKHRLEALEAAKGEALEAAKSEAGPSESE